MFKPQWRRFRFSLRTIVALTTIVAVALTLVARLLPDWKEYHLQTAYVEATPEPFWWPDDWVARQAALRGEHFEYTYHFGDTPEELAVLELLEGCFEDVVNPPGEPNLTSDPEFVQRFFVDSGEVPPPVPRVEWSNDKRSCRVVTTGANHRSYYADIARLRASLKPQPATKTAVAPAQVD